MTQETEREAHTRRYKIDWIRDNYTGNMEMFIDPCALFDRIAELEDEVEAARARVGKVEVEAILQKFAAVADREYCNGIHMATYDDDTNGWEYRAKNGQYGEAEHKAHEKMNKHFGAHYKIYEVINEIRAALSAQTKPVEPTEFEIALKAREMEKEYNEQFGSDAIRPDFIASAKLALSESSEAKPVVANQQDAYNTPTALNMSKPVEVGELVEVIAAANRTVTRNGIQLSVPRSLLCAIAALDALIAIGAVRVK